MQKTPTKDIPTGNAPESIPVETHSAAVANPFLATTELVGRIVESGIATSEEIIIISTKTGFQVLLAVSDEVAIARFRKMFADAISGSGHWSKTPIQTGVKSTGDLFPESGTFPVTIISSKGFFKPPDILTDSRRTDSKIPE